MIALALSTLTLAVTQDDGPKKEQGVEKKKELTARQKSIAQQFNATSIEFTSEDHIVLEYDFTSEDEQLLEDFTPDIRQTKRRIRWATEDEGLMIAMGGNFVHKAPFSNTLSIQVIGESCAMMKDGSFRVVGLFDKKGRKMIGSNVGKQLVTLSGAKIRRAIPKESATTRVGEDLDFGFTLDKGVAAVLRSGKRRLDSSELPKFTRGFEKGRLGISWSGRTQMLVRTIRIEGILDPKWLKEKVGDE